MLVAVSAAHGRHALTRLWAEHMRFNIQVPCVVAVTEGEQENIEALGQWHVITEAPNAPLGNKFNAALDFALEWFPNTTRVMILPSDDFVSPEWVEAARTHPGDYLIPHTCAIVQPPANAYCFTRLTFGTLKFGAGRVVSRKAIEACGGNLWPSELNRGLDTASHQRLRHHGITHTIVETPGIPVTDVKTPENIWPYRTWHGVGTRDMDIDEAMHMVSPEILEKIKAL